MPESARAKPVDVSNAGARSSQQCDPKESGGSGPTREGGGTTGAGNLSDMQASRTGGATSGVSDAANVDRRAGDLEPDA